MTSVRIPVFSMHSFPFFSVIHIPAFILISFWMLYSTGSDQLLISSILYAPGILIFALGKQERHEPTFRFRYESFIAAALVVLAMLSLYLIFNGTLKPF